MTEKEMREKAMRVKARQVMEEKGIQGPDRGAFEVSGQGLLRGAVEALPAAGGVVGGVVGAPLGPIGIGGGSVLGAGFGAAAKNIIRSQLYDEPVNRSELYGGPLREGALEMGGVGMGMLAGKGAAAIGRYGVRPAKQMLTQFGRGADAVDIPLRESAERLGVQPTRGMESGDPFIQKMESAAAQTPTPTGQKMAREFEAIGEGMREGAETKVFGELSEETGYQAGARAKGLVETGVEKKLENAKSIYDKVQSELRVIPTDPTSLERVSKNIEMLPYAKIEGTPENALAKRITDNLRKIGGKYDVGNLEDLRNIKSYVGQIAGDPNASPTMKNTAGQIYEKLVRQEQNTITRAAVNAARNPEHGKAVAKEMIGEIKQANKEYRQVSESLKSLGRKLGIGKVKNYADFVRKMSDVPDEKFVDKVFQPKNIAALDDFSKEFPEAFEALRQSKVNQLYMKSLTPKKELSVPKLVREAQKMQPEFKRLVFGDDAVQALDDIEMVYSKTFGKVGPSGTPEGAQYLDFEALSPTGWYRELKEIARRRLLKSGERMSRSYMKDAMKNQMYDFPSPLRGANQPGLLLRQTPRAAEGLLSE